jgi:hypothetical protein
MIVSQHCYEAALHITITVDIALGRLDGPRALHLFGNDISRLELAISGEGIGLTKQYGLVGNMVSPTVAKSLGMAISRALERPKDAA